jgi:hypothetical protein
LSGEWLLAAKFAQDFLQAGIKEKVSTYFVRTVGLKKPRVPLERVWIVREDSAFGITSTTGRQDSHVVVKECLDLFRRKEALREHIALLLEFLPAIRSS